MTDGEVGAAQDASCHAQVLPLDALKDGQTYEGWPCRQCGLLIAIDESWPEAARIPDAQFVVAICPQCKTERRGTWADREKLKWQHVDRPGSK